MHTSEHTIPLLPSKTLQRQHLLDKLSLIIHHKITLVIASPGFGKTTLMEQFASKSDHKVVWHTLEEREKDLPNLAQHTQEVLSNFIAELGTPGYPSGIAPNDIATRIVKRLNDSLTQDLIYIMDDIHHIVGSSQSEIWLNALINQLPSKCHLVLVGRSIPSLPLTNMIAHGQVLTISQVELQFTVQEVLNLAAQLGTTLTQSDLESISATLKGWPAGIFLALLPQSGDFYPSPLLHEDISQNLFKALADGMLHALPLPLRHFLLSSSTLERMTPLLCKTILGEQNSQKHFADVLQRGLFVSQVPGGLKYHTLFRDFLQDYLQQQNPAHYIQLHLKAGEWFAANNQPEEAVTHFVMAGHLHRATEIVEQTAQSFLSLGRIETLLGWNEILAQTDLDLPRLHYTCAMIYTDRFEFDLANEHLLTAENSFKRQGFSQGLMQVLLLQSTISLRKGEYSQSIQKSEHLLTQSDITLNMRAAALSNLGVAHLYLGNADAARKHLESALPLHYEIGDSYATAQLLMSLDVAYINVGKFERAATVLQEAIVLLRSLGNAAALGMALNNLGYHYQLLGEYERATEVFYEGLDITSGIPDKRPKSYLLWSLGDLRRDCSAFSGAEELYHQALKLTESSEPNVRCGILNSLSVLRRWQARSDEALNYASEALQLAQKHSLKLEQTKAEVSISLNLDIDNIANTNENLVQAMEVFRNHQMETRVAQTLGMLAFGALEVGDKARCHDYLRQAVDDTSNPANLQLLVAEVIHIPALKAFVLDHPGKYEPLVKGLKRLESVQFEHQSDSDQTATETTLPTYSVRVWTLGHEAVERDGDIIPRSDWESSAARELFYYLLFVRGATLEQISLEFWPDSSPAKVRRNFHATLHRARQAVGGNVIVFENHLYRMNSDVNIWCDAFEFESLVQQARLLSPMVAHTEHLWERAVELYRGDFLPSSNADWVTAYREALLQGQLESLVGLANCLHTRGDTHEGIAVLKRALQLDAYREDIHRQLFRFYADIGEPSQIQRQLDELQDLLWRELGTDPSSETLFLAQELLK